MSDKAGNRVHTSRDMLAQDLSRTARIVNHKAVPWDAHRGAPSTHLNGAGIWPGVLTIGGIAIATTYGPAELDRIARCVFAAPFTHTLYVSRAA